MGGAMGTINSELVIAQGRIEVSKRNGEDSKRYFHGPKHTIMVLQCVDKLCRMAGTSEYVASLLFIAAAWHDVEHSLGPGRNEQESARLAGESMRRYGYNWEEVANVQRFIDGTTVWVAQDGSLHQKAEQMGKLEKLLADADLGYLGADQKTFEEMCLLYMAEKLGKPVAELTQEELAEGWANQKKFMTRREFLTTEAEELMIPNLLYNEFEALRLSLKK